MKRIRTTQRTDNFTSEVRTPKRSYGRQIYFSILGVLILQLGNYFFGRWYLFTLYGKHINTLKTIIYEMDEN